MVANHHTTTGTGTIQIRIAKPVCAIPLKPIHTEPWVTIKIKQELRRLQKEDEIKKIGAERKERGSKFSSYPYTCC
jgi:hypothetical protein